MAAVSQTAAETAVSVTTGAQQKPPAPPVSPAYSNPCTQVLEPSHSLLISAPIFTYRKALPKAELLLEHVRIVVLVSYLILLIVPENSLKNVFPVKYVFVVFHSHSLLIVPYFILSFSRQVFKALVAEQIFVEFGMLEGRSLMGG